MISSRLIAACWPRMAFYWTIEGWLDSDAGPTVTAVAFKRHVKWPFYTICRLISPTLRLLWAESYGRSGGKYRYLCEKNVYIYFVDYMSYDTWGVECRYSYPVLYAVTVCLTRYIVKHLMYMFKILYTKFYTSQCFHYHLVLIILIIGVVKVWDYFQNNRWNRRLFLGD